MPSLCARRRAERRAVGGWSDGGSGPRTRRSVGVREVQRVIAEIMDRVQAGQPQTISLNGRFPVVLISIDEFDRLRDLSRTVSWFRAAGLDLVEADEPEIAEFVRRFREGPAAADESGSAAG